MPPSKIQYRKGFMRFQRLGPIKFAEQSRWGARAPERQGLWAFPHGHFEMFFAYHRYIDLLPKELKDKKDLKHSKLKHPKWYSKDYNGLIPVKTVELGLIKSEYSLHDEPELVPCYRDENNNLKQAYLTEAWFKAQDDWIEKVGKKVLPLRDFWYRGELYTRFTPAGEIGSFTMQADGSPGEWTLMHTEKLEKIMRKPGSVISNETHSADGKPMSYNISKDHLEVFIPRNRGAIRDKI